jgi:hypothetical protein
MECAFMTYENEVRQGIELLDKAGPPDWRERINLDTLHMQEPHGPCGCILAQVYGDFYNGVEELRTADSVTSHGFDVRLTDVDRGRLGEHYDDLREAWKEALSSTD